VRVRATGENTTTTSCQSGFEPLVVTPEIGLSAPSRSRWSDHRAAFFGDNEDFSVTKREQFDLFAAGHVIYSCGGWLAWTDRLHWWTHHDDCATRRPAAQFALTRWRGR
jgi:hypothetical protein